MLLVLPFDSSEGAPGTNVAAFFYGLEAVTALGRPGRVRLASTKKTDQERQSNSNIEVVEVKEQAP